MLRQSHPKHLYLKYSKKIKNFLLSAKSREFLIFLFFLFIASGFWLLQTLDKEYETEIDVPIRLKGVPEDVVITSDIVPNVQVKIKDRGTALFNYLLRGQLAPVFIDFNEDFVKNNHVKIRSTDIERKVLGQFNVSTRLLSLSPDTLDYIYSTGKSKLIPVKLSGYITAARQYYISDTLYSPDSVKVYAPQAILDTLTAAYTQPFKKTDISDTLRCNLTLAKIRGVKFVPDHINCTLTTDIYTEKTLEVPIVGIGFPSDKVLRTFPSKVKVTFRVGVGQFKQVTADDFSIVVPYENLFRNNSDKCGVMLQYAPDGVSQIRITPEQVDFLIEQNTVSVNEH